MLIGQVYEVDIIQNVCTVDKRFANSFSSDDGGIRCSQLFDKYAHILVGVGKISQMRLLVHWLELLETSEFVFPFEIYAHWNILARETVMVTTNA